MGSQMDLMAKFISTITDDELTDLTVMVHDEKDKRIQWKIVNEHYPELTEREHCLLTQGKRVEAIRNYYHRNKHLNCSLNEAKKVIDSLGM